MATDLRPAQTGPAGKYDTFIESQLERVEKRIRSLDLMAALLGLLVGTLVYAVVMALVDRKFDLSDGSRRVALFVYLAAATAYLAVTVLRPLRRSVNPYYAARQLEQSLPGAKNSIVNWVDLREQKLPAVLRGAVGQRAAKDIANTDVDEAISGRRTAYTGLAAAAVGVLLVALFFAIGPRPFLSLLGRAFVPFGAGGTKIATRTWIEVVRPEGGHVSVPIGSPLTVAAEVGGKVPEPSDPRAPRLLYRQADDEPWRERLLTLDDSRREWLVTLPPNEVPSAGLTYKVSAGDADTPEYRVTVRAPLLPIDFQVTYHYLPYTGRAPRVSGDRKVEDLRGTKVEVLVTANRPVPEGKLELEVTDGTLLTVRSEPVADDPQALRFRFDLDRSGKYRLRFHAPDGEGYADPVRHDIIATPDEAPYVKLTEPGKNVELPLDGVLRLKGEATDNIGVKSLTLRLQVVPNLKLQPLPSQGGAKLDLPGGGHPRRVEYQDFIDLAKLKNLAGQSPQLVVGQEVEYWLEASDACTAPRPNVTESSPRYRVKLVHAPAKDEKKQEKEREEARQQQKEHEKKQEDQLRQEEQRREQERREQQERNEKQEQERKEKRNGTKPKKQDGPGKSKEEQSSAGKEGKKSPSSESAKEGGQGEKPQTKEQKDQQEKDRKTQQRADELKKRAEERAEQKKKEEGERKPGAGKDEGEPAPAKGKPGAKGEEKKSPGAGKDGERKDAGEGKDEGKKPDGSPDKGGKESASAPKPDGNGGAEKKDKGEGKGDGGKPGEPRAEDAKQGKGKAGGKPGPKQPPGPGQAKPSAKPEERAQSAESKDKGEAKNGEERAEPASGKEAAPKPKSGEPRAEAKGKEGPASTTPCPKCEGKGTGNGSGPPPAGSGKGKSSGGKGESAAKSKGERPKEKRAAEAKSDGSGEGPKEGPRPQDREQLAKQLKDLDERLKKASAEEKPKLQEERANLEEDLRDLIKSEQKTGGKARPKQPRGKDGQPGAKEGEAKEDKGPPSDASQGKGQGSTSDLLKKLGQGKSDRGQADEQRKQDLEKKLDDLRKQLQSPDENIRKQAMKQTEEIGKQFREFQRQDKERRRLGQREQGTGKPPVREKPAPHRATMLQLEQLKKTIDKDLLKDAKMSPEDWQRFLKDYQDLARRQRAQAKAEAKLRASSGGRLPTIGSGPLAPRGTSQPGDSGDGRAQPPPGYSDPYAEFLRRIATPGR